MQLYAKDCDSELVSSRRALKQTDYFCLECQNIVRLRGGPQRQPHFYHLDPPPSCRQHQKGAIHLHLQSFFLHQLPLGDCQLEYSFPSIGRIADVVWFSEKVIFEIQCSPISPQEVLMRNRDYQKLGWQVVWILHDQRYNQARLSGAEIALRPFPHYFSDMNDMGSGIIYDQFDVCENGLRLGKLVPLPIDIRKKELFSSQNPSNSLLFLLNRRTASWPFFFKDDLMDQFIHNSLPEYFSNAKNIEKSLIPGTKSFIWHQLPFVLWKRGIVQPYHIFFRYILEKMTR